MTPARDSDPPTSMASTTRGWTATGSWHEVAWDTCVLGLPGTQVGGASTNPGAAWYFGVDLSCDYPIDEVGLLESAVSATPQLLCACACPGSMRVAAARRSARLRAISTDA